MGALFGGIFGAIVKWLLGKFFGKKEPTEADRAAEAATAETELTQQEAATDVQAKAAATRAADDTAVMRAVTDASGDADAKARLRAKFGNQFRD